MKQNWTWTGRYTLAIATALVLGGIIGEMTLFQQATLGTPKLTAARIVKFLGYSGALGLLWLLGQRAAQQVQSAGGKTAFLGMILVPLLTLIIVSSAYSVLLVILKPFLDPSLRNIYNWVFVLAITVSALWFVVALFHHSEPLMELFKSSVARSPENGGSRCRDCGTTVVAKAKFCQSCGIPVI